MSPQPSPGSRNTWPDLPGPGHQAQDLQREGLGRAWGVGLGFGLGRGLGFGVGGFGFWALGFEVSKFGLGGLELLEGGLKGSLHHGAEVIGCSTMKYTSRVQA